ncbi:hypothetical protein [Staphylococcus pseudintermedius]|uniref:hypothetical protein n=1 Tax=Staphylococcus pseudintermedius TaxID=283734 RepID=UPI001F2CF8B8
MKTKAAGTEAQVEANATLAKALKQQLDLIQSIANERELLTKGEFNEALNTVNNNVDAISSKIDTLKRETTEELERIKDEVTGVKTVCLMMLLILQNRVCTTLTVQRKTYRRVIITMQMVILKL